MLRTVLLAAALAAPVPALADTITLDFAEEAQGDRGNSFLSTECGCVVLSEASGFETLVIITTSLEGTPAIVPGSQGGSLRLDFVDALVTGVAITFGGDYPPDPEYSVYPATLSGYVGDALVATATLDANQNFLMDQTVSLVWSEPLTHATFSFVQFGPHQPESPFIGGITLTVESVPEPGVATLLLAAGGLGLAQARSRSRRHSGKC